jgi:hypothetical protein
MKRVEKYAFKSEMRKYKGKGESREILNNFTHRSSKDWNP